MDRGAAVALTVTTGALVALQAPVNAILGRSLGDIGAASVNFIVGAVALTVLAFAVGGYGTGPDESSPWYAWVGGGLLGAAYVTSVLITVRSLGATGVTAATIAGQLAMSLVADRLGILGLEEKPITAARVAGIVLLGIGTFLVVRD
jgi:bacterial/archaeal transporter family-2 protein